MRAELKCFIFFLGLMFLANPSSGQNIRKIIKQETWQKEKISRGLIWRALHTDRLFDSQQYINLLSVGKKRRLSLDFERTDLKPTSRFAEEENALAAVNAGFFNMKDGGSVTFMKADDAVINPNATGNQLISTHCIAIDEQGILSILPAADTAYLAQPAHFDDVLFTGPLLLLQGKPVSGGGTSFLDKRHPRTCACTLKNGNTLLVTVDGRNEQAQGMSIPELTQLLQGLGCFNAINLDGGGSTTMWIRGKGVVNHPSDNQFFDAQGERKVANVLLVKK